MSMQSDVGREVAAKAILDVIEAGRKAGKLPDEILDAIEKTAKAICSPWW